MTEQNRFTRRDGMVCLLLLLLVLAVFGQVYRFALLTYDDTEYVSENPAIYNGITWAGLVEVVLHGHVVLWNPLTSFTYMLGCELYGLSPAGHHLTNLPFHVANVLLLYWILRRWTGAFWRPLVVAALFAVHPLNVEPVAWVSGRKELVYTTCWMLTLLAYERYVRRGGVARYLWVCVFFVLGLAAKFSQIVLPFALLLLDYWPLRRHAGDESGRRCAAVWARLVVEKLPLMALSAGLVALSMALMRGGAMRPLEAVPLSHRVINASVVYLWCLSKAFWPSRLTVHYPYPVEPFPLWLALTGYGVLLAVSLAAVLLGRRRSYAAVGWFWFAGGLVPVAGLVRVSSFLMADRYAYVPLIGLFIAVVWTGTDLAERRPRVRYVLAALAAVYVAGFALRAGVQTRYWQDDLTLFSHAVDITPDGPSAHNNLGLALRRAGRTQEAIAEFACAANLPGPFKVHPLMNLGTLLAEQGRTDDAATHFLTVIRNNPGYAPAHLFLGRLRAQQGRTEEAIREFSQALVLGKDNGEARDELRKLGVTEPDLAAALDEIGNTYYGLGRLDDAVRQYHAALELNPNRAATHNHLGVALAASGTADEAGKEFRAALDLQPEDADAMANLGVLLASQGRLTEAVALFRKALEYAPGHVGARYDLARALADSGDLQAAAAEYEAVLRIQPNHAAARAELSRIRAGN